MRIHHISLYRETIHAPSFYVSKLHCNFYESRRAYFSKSIYLQSCFSQTNDSAILKKFLKIKTPTRKKCSKSKVLFPTLFTEHLFWSHRIRFNVHAKKSFFLKRAVHFLTNCQKVNIVFFTLFQDFSVKCRIDIFSLGCEVESSCAKPFCKSHTRIKCEWSSRSLFSKFERCSDKLFIRCVSSIQFDNDIHSFQLTVK